MTTTVSEDLPLPNIYFCSVNNALTNENHTIYVAADFTGSALKKVQRLCVDRHGFKPVRANSIVKMRRLKLRDMLECSGALGLAMVTARELGERDTLAALAKRPKQVRDAAQMQNLLSGDAGGAIDAEAVMRALGDALRSADVAAVG